MRPGVLVVQRFWLQLLATVLPSRVTSSGHCFQYPTWKTHNHYITVLVGTDTHTVCVLWQMTRVTRWSRIMCSYLSQDHARGRGWVQAEYVRMWPLHGDQWSRLYRATQLHLHWYWIWASAGYFDFLVSDRCCLLNIMRCKCNNLSLMKIYPIKYGDEYVKYLCSTFG